MSSPSAGTTVSPEEVLALMIDANLSKHQYDVIRQKGNKCVKNMYPAVKDAKNKCYFSVIEIAENRVDISMQPLVDHTIQRVCLSQEVLVAPDMQDIQLLIKWGCDGAQQHRYK